MPRRCGSPAARASASTISATPGDVHGKCDRWSTSSWVCLSVARCILRGHDERVTAGDEQGRGAVTIRVERPDDYAAIAEVVAAAFGSQAEAQLVEAIRASPGFVPE